MCACYGAKQVLDVRAERQFCTRGLLSRLRPMECAPAERTDPDSCQRWCQVAAVGLEQAGEQPVRAPTCEPVVGPVAAEPDLEIAELVEHRGAQQQRATVDWIPFTSCDCERSRASVVVGP